MSLAIRLYRSYQGQAGFDLHCNTHLLAIDHTCGHDVNRRCSMLNTETQNIGFTFINHREWGILYIAKETFS